MRSNKMGAYIALMVTVLFWGLSFVSSKIVLAVLPPMSLGALRFAIAAVLLYIAKCALFPKEKLLLRDLPVLAGAGLTGVTLYFFFENHALLYLDAGKSSIIVAAVPVMALLLKQAAGRLNVRGSGKNLSPLTTRRWAGVLLSVLGVALVAKSDLSISPGSGKGYLLMFGAALSWVVYCFLTRGICARHSQVFITFWQSLAGFLGFLPFVPGEMSRWGTFTPAITVHLIYLGVACSALGYLFYAKALAELGVEISTVFINLVPVVTVAAGLCFLGERLTTAQWAGAAIVLAGVYLATLEKRTPQK